jgi:phospho-N-acetylmuramoyl-pentapeptide-transferase
MADFTSEPLSELSSKSSFWGDLFTFALMILLTVGIGVTVPVGVHPFIWTNLIVLFLGFAVVPLLRYWKTGQVIREEGPQSHFSKAGTPTMGGIYFIPVGLVTSVLWTHLDPDVIAAVGLALAYGAVGWLDDFQVIRKQSNKGLTPKQKLLLQLIIGIGFCLWIFWRGISWSLVLPGVEIPLSWAFWPLSIFVLLGTSNAVNLTDGMDGLAAGVVAILLVGLGVLINPEHPELSLFCFCMAGSCSGFLWQNRYPARVFMGDTGSLGLGGALAAVALLSQSLWALAIMGGLLVVEALSVILQVSYFKYTKRKTGEGKRLLRMSPLHHHLELGGWSETKVVFVFYLITGILVVGGHWFAHLV